MANKIKIGISLLLLGFLSCGQDPDFGGLFYSPTRVDERFEQSMAWNKTHAMQNLIIADETYQLLISSDIHIGGLDNYNAMLEIAKQPENIAMVIVGDVVTGREEDYDLLKGVLPDFDELPSFLLVGNHDLYFGGWESYYKYFGSSVYYFTVETPQHKDIFICLDSGGGTLGGKQIVWLRKLLEQERKNYRNCVVFTHVNFFREHHTGSTNLLETELEVLLPLFAEHTVNMVIMGHDHSRAVTQFGNTTYLTTDALKDGLANASVIQLKVTKEKIGYEFKELY